MTELEDSLMQMLKEERRRNDSLLTILLDNLNMLPKDIEVRTAENDSVGYMPWYLRKSKLERMYAQSRHLADKEVEDNGSSSSSESESESNKERSEISK
jgi:hypothetical protein